MSFPPRGRGPRRFSSRAEPYARSQSTAMDVDTPSATRRVVKISAPSSADPNTVLRRINAITSGQTESKSNERSGEEAPWNDSIMVGDKRIVVGGMVSDRVNSGNLKSKGIRGASEAETIVKISNLHYEVSEEDLKEFFAEFGIKSVKILYDRAGRSQEEAELAFPSSQNAFDAIKKYDGVILDGRTLKMEFLKGANKSILDRIGGSGADSDRWDTARRPSVMERLSIVGSAKRRSSKPKPATRSSRFDFNRLSRPF